MYLSKKFAALPPAAKRRARLRLYGSLAAVMAAAALSVAILGRPGRPGDDQGWVDTEFLELSEVQLLRDYVRIDTSPTTGSELAGARFLAERLEAAGLEPQIERLGEQQANLWAVLEGERPEAIVLHSHIDVYPVEDPDGWDFPPYEGVIDQAWLYGRGAFDMKSITIAQLLALTELAQSGHRPERSVIFLATGSEEVGSDLGARWILARHPELAERFWVVLTEGGVVEALSYEEVKYWGIEFAQKWFAQGWACAPRRERLEELRSDLDELSDRRFELRLGPEVEAFLSAYAGSRAGEEYQRILRDTREALMHPDRFEALPTYLKSLFRDEIATFPIEADPEGGFRMRFILHLLPRSDLEQARQALLPPWIVQGVELTLDPPAGVGDGSPLEHPAFRELQAAVRDRYPSATVGPYFLPWSATDSRFFRQAGIPSYGFSPFLIFATDTFRRDTRNERIGLPGFLGGVELYRQVLVRLAG